MGPHGLGYPSNGVDDQGYKLYIVAVVMVIFSGLFVTGRCATRFCMFGKLSQDDYAVIAAQAFSILLSVMMCLAIENGYGMHKADLSKEELRLALKQFFIAQTPYKLVVGLNKVAIVLLYLRLFITRTFRYAAFTVLFIIVSWTIATVGATILQCVPVSGAWNKNVKAQCIDSDVFWVAYAIGNIITDIMVLVLPIPSVLSLKLRLHDRLMLCGLFLLGIFVTVASIVRVTSVQNSLKSKADLTYNFIQRGIWTLLEANLGTISACLPILRYPLSRLFPRLFASTRHGASAYDNYRKGGSGGPAAGMNAAGASGRGAASLHRKDGSHMLRLDHQSSKVGTTSTNSSGSKLGKWRNSVTVATTVGKADPRKSDEQLVRAEAIQGDYNSDDAYYGIEGSDAPRSLGEPPGAIILKRIELVRTSFNDNETDWEHQTRM